MKVSVSNSVRELFPEIVIGVVTGKGVGLRADGEEALIEMQAVALSNLRGRAVDTSELSQLPSIAAWRSAYQAFGVKAKRHKPTHEALARRLLSDEGWPDINPIVNVYLTNQITHLLPHGGYDSRAVSGTILLDRSGGNERFEPLGGGEEFTDEGEVVYRDDARVLTRRWNYRDCEFAKITDTSSDFILMLEAPSPAISREAVVRAAENLVARYEIVFTGDFACSLFQVASAPEIVV